MAERAISEGNLQYRMYVYTYIYIYVPYGAHHVPEGGDCSLSNYVEAKAAAAPAARGGAAAHRPSTAWHNPFFFFRVHTDDHCEWGWRQTLRVGVATLRMRLSTATPSKESWAFCVVVLPVAGLPSAWLPRLSLPTFWLPGHSRTTLTSAFTVPRTGKRRQYKLLHSERGLRHLMDAGQ